MKGNAVPVRFSRRIGRKANCSPIKMFPKKKMTGSPVKKRKSKVNTSLCIAKEKTKVGVKKKSVESSKQTSKFLKRTSRGLSSRKTIPKVCGEKRKKNCLNASQANLKNNKVSLKNVELSHSKKVEKKKIDKKFVPNEKQSVRRSLRLRDSSLGLKENLQNEELSNGDLKALKEKGSSQNKSSKQVTTLSTKLVLSSNSEKSKYKSKDKRKKSAELLSGLKNRSPKRISASKSLVVTPVPGTVNRPTRLSSNQEPGRFVKGSNRSKIINADSLCTPSFHSFLETPQPENHSEKRKSSRLSESIPLRTLNKELSFSTPASVIISDSDSTLNKSLNSCKGIDHLPPESRGRKTDKPKDGCAASQKKQRRKGSKHQKILENSPKPLSGETENLPLDILTTPAFVLPCERSRPKKYISKSDSKAAKRKFIASASKNQVTSEELQDPKKKKKSAGDKDSVDTATGPSKCSTMKKIKSSIKTNCDKRLKNNKNNENYRVPLMSIQGNVDVFSSDLFVKQSRKRVRSVPFRNEIDFLASEGSLTRKPLMRLIPYMVTVNVNNTHAIVEKTIERKSSTTKTIPTKNHNSNETSPSITEDPVAADLFKTKHRKAKSMPSKNTDRNLAFERKKNSFPEKRPKICSPSKFTPNVKLNTKSNLPNFKRGKLPINIAEHGSYKTPEANLKSDLSIKEDSLTAGLYEADCRTKSVFKTTLPEKKFIKILQPIEISLNTPHHSVKEKLSQFPVDYLTINDVASCSQNIDRQVVNVLSPCCISKEKTDLQPLQNGHLNETNDCLKIPAKGTLKRKRWLLKNLEQNNGSYEDDIFEHHYKPSFHFGDESDGSSVNIATPKFDCILTPALPKKTPRFKDCISPTEFLQARKSAEEYLYRRNKKRKSGNRQSSGKKTISNKMDTAQNIPEKRKLDYTETVNKLFEVQKGLEIEAEIDDEEKDSYFSDASD